MSKEMKKKKMCSDINESFEVRNFSYDKYVCNWLTTLDTGEGYDFVLNGHVIWALSNSR